MRWGLWAPPAGLQAEAAEPPLRAEQNQNDLLESRRPRPRGPLRTRTPHRPHHWARCVLLPPGPSHVPL